MQIGIGLGINRARMRPQSSGGGAAERPATDADWVVLEADMIEGKAEDAAVETGDWTDVSANEFEPTLDGATYKEDALNGNPAVRFDSSLGLQIRLSSQGKHIANNVPYTFFLIWRMYGTPAHLDTPFEEGASSKLHLVWSTTTPARWRLYARYAYEELSPNGATTFDDWGLMQVVNPRTTDGELLWEGDTIASFDGTAYTESYDEVRVAHEGIDMDCAAIILLRDPSPEDVSAWRSYLASKYGVTA